MTFTHGVPVSAPAAKKGKPRAEDDAKTLEEINSKQDAILRTLTVEQSDTNNARAADLISQLQGFPAFMKDFQDMNDKLQQTRDECFAAKAELLEAQNKVNQRDSKLLDEQRTNVALRADLEKVKETLSSLQGENSEGRSVVQAVRERVQDLEKQLSQADEAKAVAFAEKQRLQAELVTRRTACDSLEAEVERLNSLLKEVRRQLQEAESEGAAKDVDLRRTRREKDDAQSEREELENSLQQKVTALQDARTKCTSYSAELEQLRKTQGDAKEQAERHVQQVTAESSARVAALEKELEESKRYGEACSAELENRKKEVVHMRDAVALQESNMSRSNCEKMSLEARVSALRGEVSAKTEEIASMTKLNKDQQEAIVVLELQAREDAAMRRKLHNAIQELKGNIRVFCRVRPLLPKELDSAEASVAKEMFAYNEKGQGLVARHPAHGEKKSNLQPYPFKFDRVFGPKCQQETVFEEISQLVQSALDGYRVCIFAYGQTGSGKTHTMLGNRGEGNAQLGMIPRSVRQVFETAKQLEKDEWSFNLKASFLEIYNETVRDLLVSNAPSHRPKGKDDKHRIIYDHEKKLSTVSDLTVVAVENEQQVQRLIDMSMRNRSTAATQANERSSRSHSVFRLSIEGSNASTGQRLNGLLNLVDLAGSERLAQSKAEGDRLRETRHINKSLSALGDVIAALANQERHIPFRNSKLTHLLQDSLGGDSKTLMFVNVSHAVESFNESLCSLRFAAKVNSCHVGTARRSAKIEF